VGEDFGGEEGIVFGEGTVVEDEDEFNASCEGLKGVRNPSI
jgi:hypothetical protein